MIQTMIRTFLIGAGLLGAMLSGPAAALAADGVATVKTTQGAAFIVAGNDRTPAAVGLVVPEHATLETGEGASIGVTFRDNSTVSIGPNTQIAIDDFVFKPEAQQYAFVTRMAKGTMAYVSGTIAKISPESVAVKTPVGTIGVRGTRFLVKLDD
jgi:hypothetical protein